MALALVGCPGEPDKVWECILTDADADFAQQIGCQADFDALASAPLDASIPGARSCKTVMDRFDDDAQYFQNSTRYPIHWEFASAHLSAPDHALVDGTHAPDLPCPSDCVVRGDSRSASIAAASIIAKVTRDRIMAALARHYPGYGWERNRGYATPEHRAALGRFGVTPHHRRSFAPVFEVLNQLGPAFD